MKILTPQAEAEAEAETETEAGAELASGTSTISGR